MLYPVSLYINEFYIGRHIDLFKNLTGFQSYYIFRGKKKGVELIVVNFTYVNFIFTTISKLERERLEASLFLNVLNGKYSNESVHKNV